MIHMLLNHTEKKRILNCDIELKIDCRGSSLSMGSLSNCDGKAKENVALKMTSKYFKLLRDSFNSFNLSNAAEQSGS